MVAADVAGESPRETADRFNAFIREDLRDLGLSYDLFTRTTTKNHYSVTRDVFRTLYEKGYVIEKETLGAFSASTGHTLPDRYIEGTCPICGFPAARGDQCDNCGNQLDPIGPDRAAIADRRHPARCSRRRSTSSSTCPRSRSSSRTGSGRRTPGGRTYSRFSLNFVQELKPRPITRDLDWGVPIPVEGYDDRNDKRIYVWFDAVIGYLSASIEWAANRGSPGRLARVVAEPGSRAHVLHGEGQHRLPYRDLAEHAARVRHRAASTVRDEATSSCPTTSRRASS